MQDSLYSPFEGGWGGGGVRGGNGLQVEMQTFNCFSQKYQKSLHNLRCEEIPTHVVLCSYKLSPKWSNLSTSTVTIVFCLG
jgi:hypothetical protein